MFYNINLGASGLSPFNKYRNKTKSDTSKSVIDFTSLTKKPAFVKTGTTNLFGIKEEKKEASFDIFEDELSLEEDDSDSNTKIEKYPHGAIKKTTRYDDGSYDEIYKAKNGLSYMRIKRYESENSYTEIYRDSSGFCGKETFTTNPDGSTVSTNEFSNGKKYTETYRKNPDGGFTRKLENNDGTGYTETQAYNKDGSSSYSIENADGSGNTVIYNTDGSYTEISVDSNGNKTINKFEM